MNHSIFLIGLLCSLGIHAGLVVGLYSWGSGPGSHDQSLNPIYSIVVVGSVESGAESSLEPEAKVNLVTPPRKPIQKLAPAISIESPQKRSSQQPRAALMGSDVARESAQPDKPDSKSVGGLAGARDVKGSNVGGDGAVSAQLLGIDAQFPYRARQRGQQGTVVCRAFVNSQGKVANSQIVRSSGFELLDQAAMNALSEAYLDSPPVRGSPVLGRSSIDVAFRFELH